MVTADTHASDSEIEGYAVAVVREDSGWAVSALDPGALDSLEDAESQLLELRASGAIFGLLDVDDEFFVVVRPSPSGIAPPSPTTMMMRSGTPGGSGASAPAAVGRPSRTPETIILTFWKSL